MLEHDKNRVMFQLKGAGHTFCNNLKRELYGEKEVEVSSYRVDHPLIGTPTFIVETKGSAKISDLMKATADRIKKENKEFLAAFKKVK